MVTLDSDIVVRLDSDIVVTLDSDIVVTLYSDIVVTLDSDIVVTLDSDIVVLLFTMLCSNGALQEIQRSESMVKLNPETVGQTKALAVHTCDMPFISCIYVKSA